LKRLALRRQCLEEDVWVNKQEAEPGVLLPATFPSLSVLSTAGYTTVEDLDGADTHELRRATGMSQRQAEAVLAALAAL
jgi:hypothetical protein